MALVCAAALLLAQPALAKGSKTFADATAENPAAADIGTVTVANDDTGAIEVKIGFTNMPDLAADARVFVAFDTDRNARTGDTTGAEYVMVLDGTDRTWTFVRWNGTAYEEAPGDLQVGFEASTASIALKQSELGGVSSFDFFVFSVRGAEGAEVTDDAPADGVWTYDVQLKPVIDSVSARFAPAQPRAGKAFALPAVELKLEDGQVVKPTSVRCSAKLNGKTIRGTGPGGCRWNVPKDARGKRLVVTVTVRYECADPVTATTTLKVR